MNDPRIHTTVEVVDGDAVIVRRATDPDAQRDLGRGLRTSWQASPTRGLEDVLGVSSTGEATEVRIRAPGGRTLASSPPVTPPGLPRAVAAVAQVFADLHQLGLTHGPIRCAQVALGGDARPVLMDFSAGHRRSEVDDDRWMALVADDVRGIGTLIDELIELLPDDDLGWGR